MKSSTTGSLYGKNNRITYSNMYRDYLYGRNFWFSYTYAF